MFGKAEWFRPKATGFGLHPVTWRGWLYALAWGAVIGTPFIGLMARHQGPEAVVWLLAALGMLSWDVRGIRRGFADSNDQKVLYIGEDGACQSLAAAGRGCQAGK
jgi:hypothetical protein